MKDIKNWLDFLLGKLTMYHVVVQALALLIFAAFVLMFTEYLSYSPIAFAVSILLFCTGAYAFNKLFGWLFGVKPHAESAVITGLILALIVNPYKIPHDILFLTAVSGLAISSKFILAIKKKHIFNPAAIAIVVASVSQLAYASWWVATPALLPVAIVSALLVLYKTQKTYMALLFLTIAVTLITIQTALSGQLTTQTLIAAITSWPLVFFAGIMLSEPQTLPPRRWQQYTVAGIVAVLMTIPIHYATILMTPALALIIGNGIAFYMGIRRGVTLRLVDKKQIGKNSFELTFDTKELTFEPGQYMELSLPHKHMDLRGMRRVFTIIGRSGASQVSIATRLPEKASSFKRALTGMKNGQIVYGTRIAGDFVLPKDPSVPIVFIAGGIGITPFLSFIMAEKKRDITLIYAVSALSDILFIDELKRYDIKVIIVSPDTGVLPDPSWRLESGRVSSDIIKSYVKKSENPHVYISGPSSMVSDARSIVKNTGVRTIRTDHFTGY
ncbi:hypothetical protein HY312_04810 [Candidatus Saccharibacteria bacterium]|nr:hypothetical protein [Candidatus Saccharibacteria bacterium]